MALSCPTRGERLKEYQFRYIRLLDPEAKLTCPVLPYSDIDEVGGRMVRGAPVF